ncbi:hypothetical protein SRRS_17990 [Sporomusa rhizae]|uniref:hypothetical protein n=1 Tax=Sporomusa rhizae TaxID=357999 RepID=UPI00352B8455
MVVAYLEKDIAALKNKKPDDLKKIIQTYVEKVVVYEEYVEVFLVLFVHMSGGGEPCPCKSTHFRANDAVQTVPLYPSYFFLLHYFGSGGIIPLTSDMQFYSTK